MKILIADDEIEIRRVLRLLLEAEGYSVLEATDGESAVNTVMSNRDIDLCVMDIMMPGMSGIEATEHIREFSAVPVLFLTAKSLTEDKVLAYGSGGDDYLVKPFAPRELLMKIDALTRRYNVYSAKGEDNSEVIRLKGGIFVNITQRRVEKLGRLIDVRDKELDVLIYLLKNRGRAVGADELYSSVWGELPLPSSGNTITVHILNLRRKLEDEQSSPKLIRTVWGKGYQID